MFSPFSFIDVLIGSLCSINVSLILYSNKKLSYCWDSRASMNTQGQWKWWRSMDHIRFSTGRPLYNYSSLVPFSSYLALNNIITLKFGLEVTQGHSNLYHWKALGGFLFAFYSNYGANLYRLRYIATYWSKFEEFLYPTCIYRPRRGLPRRNFAEIFDTNETRMIALPCGEETMTIC